MPDDAIGYAFNDKAATMSITVLNLTEASALLRTINKRDIKDVRAIDLDLALVLESGHKIIISRGAVAAVNSPQLMLEFADGDVALGDVFEKLNHIEVPADAAVTVTSKEITRYGIKRVVKPKVARNKQDQEADKDKTDEENAASPDTDEARPAEALAGNDGSGGSRSGDSGSSDITARKFASGKGSSSSLAIQDVADAPADAGSSKGGISWPVIAGGLGLLAAAGGGGGGGGGSAAAPGAGSGSGAGVAATLSGAAALGPLNNATITAYDAEGRVIGKAVPVINGRYTLVLDQSGYKGLILLAIRDNTPGVADNYADEASVRMTDLGNTVLRAVALADGSNQIINVTALTELAALKAGLGTGQTNLAAAQVGATTVTGANAAVSNLFKVDILSGDVAPVTTTDAQGAAVINPAFLQSASVTARNYGIALKAIANLVQTNKERYTDNGEAIRKLADALQFTDGLQSRLKWKDGTTQSDLFGESLNARANDPTSSPKERDDARKLFDQLQKLPNGSSINDFLLDNHIALSDPAILIKNTTPGGPPWQAPRLALVNNSSGDEATHLTNDGRIDVLDLDAGASWQFSTDGGTSWTNGSGNRFMVSGDGAKRLLVRQTDAAGNTSTSSVLSMQLDATAPAKPGLPTLVADTGRDGTDRITSDARLQAPTATEADLRFEYSLDGTTWSSFNQPIRGTRDGGSDGLKKLKVSSIDRAGNRSVPSDEFSFTLDTVAPAKLVPTLLKPVSGGNTTDGTVLIGTQEAGSVWEYSLDRGTTWQVGSGDRIKIKGRDESGTDGIKSVQLRQTDAAGNVSVSEVLEFNLLTKLDAPGLTVASLIGRQPDGTGLLDVADTSSLPLGTQMVLQVSGRAGMTAVITRDDGAEVGRLLLDSTGKGSLKLGRTLTLSGLKTVSGANTTANAVAHGPAQLPGRADQE